MTAGGWEPNPRRSPSPCGAESNAGTQADCPIRKPVLTIKVQTVQWTVVYVYHSTPNLVSERRPIVPTASGVLCAVDEAHWWQGRRYNTPFRDVCPSKAAIEEYVDGESYRAISKVQHTQVRCGRLDDNHIQGQKDEIAKLCILTEKTESLGVWDKYNRAKSTGTRFSSGKNYKLKSAYSIAF